MKESLEFYKFQECKSGLSYINSWESIGAVLAYLDTNKQQIFPTNNTKLFQCITDR